MGSPGQRIEPCRLRQAGRFKQISGAGKACLAAHGELVAGWREEEIERERKRRAGGKGRGSLKRLRGGRGGGDGRGLEHDFGNLKGPVQTRPAESKFSTTREPVSGPSTTCATLAGCPRSGRRGFAGSGLAAVTA